MPDPEALARRMIELRYSDPGFSVSFLDLFAHGIAPACSEIRLDLDLSLEIAVANASLAGWASPAAIGQPELEFLRSFTVFLETAGLIQQSLNDCWANCPGRSISMAPRTVALTPSGRHLAKHIARLANAVPTADAAQHSAEGSATDPVEALATRLAAVKQRTFESEATADLDRAVAEFEAGRLGLALAFAWRARRFDLHHPRATALIRAIKAEVADRLPQLEGAEWLSPVDEIEGWLSDEEARLLARCVAGAPGHRDGAVVEIGSYKGRSTLAIALAIAQLRRPLSLTTIDLHDGYRFGDGTNTHDALVENLRANGVAASVDVICARSTDVALPGKVVFVFIDGLHDPDSVRADYGHVLPVLVPGGLLAFHDYFEHFPGLLEAVGDLLMDERFELVGYAGWLVVLRLERSRDAGRDRCEP